MRFPSRDVDKADDYRILSKYGIPTKVDLPGVGENLQDQPNTAIVLQTNTTYNGTTGYVAFSSASDFFGNVPNNSIADWALQVSNAVNNSVNASALEYLFKVQLGLISQGVPDAETIIGTTVEVGGVPRAILASAFWLLMPFSRGNVHISSPDPSVYPQINPNYFLIDFDLAIQIAIAKWARRFWATQPVSAFTAEISPGFEVVPANATDEQWGSWIKQSCKLASIIWRHV